MKKIYGAMAISSHRVKGLQEAVLCSLCREYFQDPVILKCGHNFCRACITQYCEASRSAASYACPQCGKAFGKGEFQPNRQLRNVVELTRRLPDPSGSSACKEHEEFLKLFCEVDQAPICLVCRESHSHKEHTVVPIDEAALEYKVKVQKHLESLKEREEILLLKLSEENKSQELLKQTQAERQKIVAEFQQLRHFLEEQEQLLLAQLQKLEEEIMRTQTDTVRKLSAQISRLVSLIRELEGKLQKPASEFLKVSEEHRH
nr:E3 ubiquitin-protein ligase TRIM41-like [Pelodiscus sinensis]|eukprot:XP_014435936.1 E3 ubiquitin-protein ligase TRIM41-like [Pelodiscus sinensis]